MNANFRNQELFKAVSIFVVLFSMGIAMAVGSGASDNLFQQQVLLNVGSAISGGSLAFFLVEMFHWERGK